MMFRRISPQDEAKFREMARKSYTPFSDISGTWHTVYQDECVKINAEKASFELRLARDYLTALYNDWRNNYLTVEVFAEHHGLTGQEGAAILDLARQVISHPHPES